MKLVGFEIKNFKGIKDARISFGQNDVARVHTLVGLNESGKTTLLEAMHSFSPDAETQLVVRSAKTVQEQREQAVPRDKIANFTGEVSVTAYVEASTGDWEAVGHQLQEEFDLQLDQSNLPETFTVRLVHSYKKGDFQRTSRNINIPDLRVKKRRQKQFRAPEGEDLIAVGKIIRARLPTIAYYPTFVFDFPKRIYLTDRDEHRGISSIEGCSKTSSTMTAVATRLKRAFLLDCTRWKVKDPGRSGSPHL